MTSHDRIDWTPPTSANECDMSAPPPGGPTPLSTTTECLEALNRIAVGDLSDAVSSIRRVLGHVAEARDAAHRAFLAAQDADTDAPAPRVEVLHLPNDRFAIIVHGCTAQQATEQLGQWRVFGEECGAASTILSTERLDVG